jgi:RNA polymerase sigma-70 factor (ECF subfamily)
VLEATHNRNGLANTALSKLCTTYWYPLYGYIRRKGYGKEDAQDLTQEFFSRLLEKHYLDSAGPDKGKFRSFLLTALKGFLSNERDRGNSQKRGGGQAPLSLDATDTENRFLAEPVDESSPEKVFARQWATTLLDQVMVRLGEEYYASGKQELFEAIKEFLSGDQALPYAEVGQRLGMSEGTLRVNVHRLRQRFRALLRLEIGNTVNSPAAVDEEIRDLFSALR